MEDEELERIKQKQLQDLMNAQKEAQLQAQAEVLDLDVNSFDSTVSGNKGNRLCLIHIYSSKFNLPVFFCHSLKNWMH